MPKIVVAGSLNMDLVVRTPRFPGPGETIAGQDFHTIPGGKGANQAVAAARQGAQVSMIGRVGQDGFGQQLRENLEQDGVDTRFVLTDATAPTGVALIAVDDQGENRIIIVAGANGQVTPADVEQASETIATADALLLQLEIPLPAVLRAAEIAAAHGVKVILNPAPAQPLPAALLTHVDYLIPNESEAALLADTPQGDPVAAAQKLRSMGVQTVIITLGDQGALLVDEQGNTPVPGFRVQVIDTTAAGDSFVGAFAVALAAGHSVLSAVRWANAAGALATTVLGAQPSLPTHKAVKTFLAQQEANPK